MHHQVDWLRAANGGDQTNNNSNKKYRLNKLLLIKFTSHLTPQFKFSNVFHFIFNFSFHCSFHCLISYRFFISFSIFVYYAINRWRSGIAYIDVRDLLFLHSYIGRTPFSYPCVLCKKVRPIRAKIRYIIWDVLSGLGFFSNPNYSYG